MRSHILPPILPTLLLLLAAFLSTSALAQINISGTVTSSDTGEPLIGASVYIKGTATGTITDLDGNFELSVPNENAIMVISYTGYLTSEEALKGRQTLNIILRENIAILDEVVVVGYGVQKKSDLTGAVGTVKDKDIERIPTASIEQALDRKSVV